MLKINGQELSLNQTQGVFGAWQYEKHFDRSITDDIFKVVSSTNGTQENMKLDIMLFYRLVFIMSGQYKLTDFKTFITRVDEDYNFMNDYTEVLEKAVATFFPEQRENKESNEESTIE